MLSYHIKLPVSHKTEIKQNGYNLRCTADWFRLSRKRPTSRLNADNDERISFVFWKCKTATCAKPT